MGWQPCCHNRQTKKDRQRKSVRRGYDTKEESDEHTFLKRFIKGEKMQQTSEMHKERTEIKAKSREKEHLGGGEAALTAPA